MEQWSAPHTQLLRARSRLSKHQPTEEDENARPMEVQEAVDTRSSGAGGNTTQSSKESGNSSGPVTPSGSSPPGSANGGLFPVVDEGEPEYETIIQCTDQLNSSWESDIASDMSTPDFKRGKHDLPHSAAQMSEEEWDLT